MDKKELGRESLVFLISSRPKLSRHFERKTDVSHNPGDDRRIFLDLKFSIPGFFGGRKI